jgi:hypothetical protein
MFRKSPLLVLFFTISSFLQAQTYEVYDYDMNLKTRLVYKSIALLSESVKIGSNEEGLFLLSNDFKPAVNLEGDEIYQFLEPWILVKGPNGIGAFHEYGQKILDLEYDEIETYFNFLLARKDNEYWLYKRGKGTTTYLGELESAEITNVGQIIAKRNNKYFLPLGENPDETFEYLEGNEGEYILVKTPTGFGLINMEGKIVLDPVISELEHNRGNFYYGFDQDQYLLIEGDPIRANIRYNSFHKITFENDLMLEYIHGKLRRVMEEDGILLDAVGMTDVNLMERDLYQIKFRDGKLGLLGKKGWIVQPTDSLEWINNGNEGYFAAKKNGAFGYVNKDGSWLITPSFQEAGPFSEHFASIKSGLYSGLINSNGQIVLSPEWDEIKAFQNGWGIGKKDNKLFLINASGEIKNPEGYTKVCRTESGQFLVESNEKVGLLSSNGDIILNPEYDFLKHERSNWVLAIKDSKSGLIQEDGEVIIPFDYEEIIVDNQNRQILVKSNYEPVLVIEPEPEGKKKKRGQ